MSEPQVEGRGLVIPAAIRAELLLWSLAVYPREACGLLVGRDGRVSSARLVRNLAQDPDRFELDPVEHLRVERWAERDGREVLGAWHSHPDAPARPSAADRAAAFAPWTHAILSVDESSLLELRCWSLVDGELVEVRAD